MTELLPVCSFIQVKSLGHDYWLSVNHLIIHTIIINTKRFYFVKGSINQHEEISEDSQTANGVQTEAILGIVCNINVLTRFFDKG